MDGAEVKKIMKKVRRRKADIMFSAGWNSLKIGEFKAAREWFSEGVKIYPLLLRLYVGLFMAVIKLRASQRIHSLALKIRNYY
jgi:hypothetical protein